MDDRRFDSLIRSLSVGESRRRDVLKAAAAGALGLAVGRASIDAAEAKKHRSKSTCVKTGKTCPADPTTCCSQECCLRLGQPDGGEQFCRSTNSGCCTADVGGGACPTTFPICCPPTTKKPKGFCALPDHVCCSSETGGGSCPSDRPTCCPPKPGRRGRKHLICCSGDNCCATATSAARAGSTLHTARVQGASRQ